MQELRLTTVRQETQRFALQQPRLKLARIISLLLLRAKEWLIRKQSRRYICKSWNQSVPKIKLYSKRKFSLIIGHEPMLST